MPQNDLRKTNQNLRDLSDQIKRELLLEMNCQAVAKVVAFNSEVQTVTCQILYGQQYLQRDPRSGKYAPVLVKYPLLIDLPVVVLGGGGGHITFPIAAGDECLVLFNDRDIDNWYAGTAGGAVASDRLHSMSDGFALIGVHSKSTSIARYDSSRIAITYQPAGVRQGRLKVGTKIVIGNATVDFRTQFDIFLNGLSAFLAATAGASTAGQIAAGAATFVPIAAAFKVQMDLLFEAEVGP